MAYEIEQRFEHIGTEILEASRNALYINMRYLDVALSGLAWEMTTDISRIGTDGLRLLYEPHYLAYLYRKHPMLVNRVYLHIIFALCVPAYSAPLSKGSETMASGL